MAIALCELVILQWSQILTGKTFVTIRESARKLRPQFSGRADVRTHALEPFCAQFQAHL